MKYFYYFTAIVFAVAGVLTATTPMSAEARSIDNPPEEKERGVRALEAVRDTPNGDKVMRILKKKLPSVAGGDDDGDGHADPEFREDESSPESAVKKPNAKHDWKVEEGQRAVEAQDYNAARSNKPTSKSPVDADGDDGNNDIPERMNKAELIDAIASDAKISKADAKKALEGFTNATTKILEKGDRISLIGFGSFSISKRATEEVDILGMQEEK